MNNRKQEVDRIHNAFATEMRFAALAESSGNLTDANEIRHYADLGYQAAIAALKLGPFARYEAECRHAEACGEPIIKGGQGRSDDEALAKTQALWIVGAAAAVVVLIGVVVYTLARSGLIGG